MRFREILESCWTGYQQQGMKKKGDRMVPNCVPVSEQEMEEDLKKWFKEKWVRFGPDGKIRGDCARGSSSEGKPKCLPQSKAHALGKKGRASSAAKKRREDPNPERRGKAKNVATKVRNEGRLPRAVQYRRDAELLFKEIETIRANSGKNPGYSEEMANLPSKINAINDLGFEYDIDRNGKGYLIPQQDISETFSRPETAREQQVQLMARTYAELYWGDRSITERARTAREIFNAVMSGELDTATLKMEIRALEQEQDISEEQDACYRKVKSRYKVWPSAYASGALVQCRKKGAANWGNKGKK
jgi:hypothetical protein